MNAAEVQLQINKRLTNQIREREMLGHVLNVPDHRTEILTEVKSEHFYLTNHGVLYGMYRDMFEKGLDITFDAVERHIELFAKNESQMGELKELLQSISGLVLADTTPNSIHLLNELLKNRKIYQDILVRGETMFRNNESTERIMAHIASTLVSIETGKKELHVDTVAENVVDDILNPKEANKGLQTGLTEWDYTFGGIAQDKYITIGAEPGAGKTATVIDIIGRLCENHADKVAVIFFSMEMSEKRVVKRFISRITGLTAEKLDSRMGQLSKEQRLAVQNAGEVVAQYPLEIIYQTLNCEQIALRLKKFAMENSGKHLIAVLDHIGLVVGETNEPRLNTIKASQTMKAFCRDHHGTSIVLTQLKKEVQSADRRKTFHKPTKSDIMESGQIDQDSDILILLWRPEMRFPFIPYQNNDQWNTTNQLIMLNEKNRDGQSFTDIVLFVNIGCNILRDNFNPFN